MPTASRLHFRALTLAGCRPFADGYLELADVAGDARLVIDADGRGPGAARTLLTRKGLPAMQVASHCFFAVVAVPAVDNCFLY